MLPRQPTASSTLSNEFDVCNIEAYRDLALSCVDYKNLPSSIDSALVWLDRAIALGSQGAKLDKAYLYLMKRYQKSAFLLLEEVIAAGDGKYSERAKQVLSKMGDTYYLCDSPLLNANETGNSDALTIYSDKNPHAQAMFLGWPITTFEDVAEIEKVMLSFALDIIAVQRSRDKSYYLFALTLLLNDLIIHNGEIGSQPFTVSMLQRNLSSIVEGQDNIPVQIQDVINDVQLYLVMLDETIQAMTIQISYLSYIHRLVKNYSRYLQATYGDNHKDKNLIVALNKIDGLIEAVCIHKTFQLEHADVVMVAILNITSIACEIALADNPNRDYQARRLFASIFCALTKLNSSEDQLPVEQSILPSLCKFQVEPSVNTAPTCISWPMWSRAPASKVDTQTAASAASPQPRMNG